MEDKITSRMRSAFCDELDFGASCVFDELSKDEQDRLVGIDADDGLLDYCEDAEYRGRDFADSLSEDQKLAAIRRWYLRPDGIFRGHLPADIVERYKLYDDMASRGWVHYKGEGADGYYPQSTIDRWKAQDAQEEADARDLAIGRNFGASLARLEAKADESGQGIAALVQHLPDAKKPTVISWAEAAEIFMPGIFVKQGDRFLRSAEDRKKAVDSFRRNCSNWLKAGVAGRTGLPISRDNLATTNAWQKWCDSYVVAERKATIVSEHAGRVEAEKSRRRSPTA